MRICGAFNIVKINRNLNLLIPILGEPIVEKSDDGTDKKDALGNAVERDNVVGYVHAEPITSETFDAHYLVIAKTFGAIYGEGLGYSVGPRIAGKLLRTIAQNMNVWSGPTGVEASLLRDVFQRANYVAANGDVVPFDEAVSRKLLDDSDLSEVTNSLAFFTLASSMHLPADLPGVLAGAARFWGGRTTSSNSTEFAASLKTSTAVANTGATPGSTLSLTF